ncbi:MAG: DUF5808 domain-containing protein [Polyangiales bacterium]
MTHVQRAPLLLVILAVGLVADHLAASSAERVMFIPRRHMMRGPLAFVRPLLWLITLASLLVAALHPWPVGLFSAPLLQACLSAALLHIGARTVLRGRETPPGIPPTVLPHPEGEHFLRQLSPPVQLFHLALLVVSGLAFRWLLPHLPSVTRSVGGAMISPTKLWWGLSVPGLNVALMLFVVWGINRERWRVSEKASVGVAENNEDSEDSAPQPSATMSERDQTLLDYRRALLCRFVEVLLVCINLGALIVWLGAAVGMAEGVREGLSSSTAMGVTAFVSIMLVYCIIRYASPLARIRGEVGDRVQPGASEGAYRVGGLLYFAPEDPALFVPKQRGYGSTLNFGRPSAWLFVSLVTFGPLLLAWWVL